MKFAERSVTSNLPNVAPHWGAWIEITLLSNPLVRPWGRTPLGCVD